MRAKGPSSITWKLNGRSLGSGTTSLRVAKGTTKVTAVDGPTGGIASVNVVDGVVDYGTVGSGTVVIRVKPWADVDVGGKKLGQTPFDPITLRAGHYTFHFTREGINKTVTTDVKTGGTSTVNVDMRD